MHSKLILSTKNEGINFTQLSYLLHLQTPTWRVWTQSKFEVGLQPSEPTLVTATPTQHWWLPTLANMHLTLGAHQPNIGEPDARFGHAASINTAFYRSPTQHWWPPTCENTQLTFGQTTLQELQFVSQSQFDSKIKVKKLLGDQKNKTAFFARYVRIWGQHVPLMPLGYLETLWDERFTRFSLFTVKKIINSVHKYTWSWQFQEGRFGNKSNNSTKSRQNSLIPPIISNLKKLFF